MPVGVIKIIGSLLTLPRGVVPARLWQQNAILFPAHLKPRMVYFPAGLIDAAVFFALGLVLWVYWAFGLAVPRLRNAGLPPLLALLCGVPLFQIALAVFLFAVQEKPRAVNLAASHAL